MKKTMTTDCPSTLAYLARTLRRAGWLFAVLLSTFTVTSASGQVFAPGPASAGVARGGPAFVYGAEALFLNPANVALNPYAGVEISTGRASVGAGGNLLQFKFYNDVFTSGELLSDEDVQSVLLEWFGGADSGLLRSATVSAEAVPLAVIHSIGGATLAYSMRMRNLSSVSLNGGWIDLLLSGTGTDRVIPLHGQFGVMSLTEFGVTYARKLPAGVAIGATPKLIFGNDFVESRLRSTATVTDAAITHDFDYQVRAAGGISSDVVDRIDLFSADILGGSTFSPALLSSAGFGFGLDAGATFQASTRIRLAASVTDVGYVRWSSAAQTIRPAQTSFTFDGLVLDIDRVRDEFDGNVGDFFLTTVDSLASQAYDDVEREYSAFTAPLPTTLHLGAALTTAGGRATLTGGASAPLFASPVRPSTLPDVHLGAQYALGGKVSVPLRAGVLLGGSSAITFSFGFGVHSPRFDFDIGLAATPRSDLMGAGARYAAAVSAITVRI
ncbi:MAG: hypothetical protein KJO98_13970 [Rhodothermia bacterium]|nr:hypothetical protein [Rhodothermia bacterium]